MRCLTSLIVILATELYTSSAVYIPHRYPEENFGEEMLPEERGDEEPRDLFPNDLHDEELEKAMNILRKLLILPWPNGGSPLLYVEQENYDQDQGNDMDGVSSRPEKRMRYYRKYPWKRQNVKYDPDSRFVCMPTKNEVHRLLVALHKSRYGDKNLSVDFCNRKRPAYNVFTNIHYLGK